MTAHFNGPTFTGLFASIPGAILVGGLYSSLAKTHALPPILILMIREIADVIFFKIATLCLQPRDSQAKARIYMASNLGVNAGTLTYFRHYHLIDTIGTIVFLTFMTIECVCKHFDLSRYRAEQIPVY